MRTLISILGLIAALSLSASPANAAEMNKFAQCALVPVASFNDNDTTAVGLTSRSRGVLHWQFYSQNGERLERGNFDVGSDSFTTFALDQEVGSAHKGTIGFLLFCLDDDEDGHIDASDDFSLAANAFMVKLAANDVAYIPTIPIEADNLDPSQRQDNIASWQDDPIQTLPAGTARPGDDIYAQYFIDGAAGGAQSTLYVFATDIPGRTTFKAIGPAATAQVSVNLGGGRLNVVDIESISGMDAASLLGSGLLVWSVKNGVSSAFVFTIVSSPAFGATQTILGNLDSGL